MFDNSNPYYRQVQLLVRVIPLIAKHKQFSLKGGTAINLFVRELPRLSVDVDLVYLPVNERNIALSDIIQALESIAASIEKSGIAKVHRQVETGKLFIDSNNARVKIEVSTMLRGHVLSPVMMDVCKTVEGTVGSASMQVMNIKELYAGKLCAALDRQHPRDLFDVKLLLENEGIDEELMNILLVYIMSSSRPMAELLSPNIKDIQETFKNHFEGMTLEAVSCQALEVAREQMISKIHGLLTLEHKKFLLDFKKGNANWDYFSYPEVRNMPSIKWKQLQLEKMSQPKRKSAIQKLEDILSGLGK